MKRQYSETSEERRNDRLFVSLVQRYITVWPLADILGLTGINRRILLDEDRMIWTASVLDDIKLRRSKHVSIMDVNLHTSHWRRYWASIFSSNASLKQV